MHYFPFNPSLFSLPPQGDVNYMYTTSIIRVRAWALNFIPVTRSYKSDCTIMRRWGVNPVTTSDCFGHFIR